MRRLLMFALVGIGLGYTSLSFGGAEGLETVFKKEAPILEQAQRPSIPKLLAPEPLAKVASDSIELKWTTIEAATAYALQVSGDPIFFHLIVNEPLYKGTSYTLKDVKLETNKNYYWRVAAIKEGNQEGTTKSLFNRSSFTIQ